MGQVVPLTPTMSSRKAMVLDFVTRWLADHPGSSPSLKEIAAGVGANKNRVQAHIRALESEGKLLRRPGGAKRTLALPSTVERALAELRALGWGVDGATRFIGPASPPVTFSTLPLLDASAQIAGGDAGGSGGDGADTG